MSDELRAAAERLWENLNVPIAESHLDIGDLKAVVKSVLAEHPADSDQPVTEEWLRSTFGPHLPCGTLKRYSLCFAVKHKLDFRWCPPCGRALIDCICVGDHVLIESPTRGDVRRLAAALGIELRKPT